MKSKDTEKRSFLTVAKNLALLFFLLIGSMYGTVILAEDNADSPVTDTYEAISAPTKEALYRLYNPQLQVHLYTKDNNEYTVLAGRGWRQEGVAWSIASDEGEVVYRLYHSGLKVHLYTKDSNEYAVLAGRGWRQEGIAYRSYGEIPIYRLYHPDIQRHLYTTDANEYTVLAGRGWRQEGIAFYGLEKGGQQSATEPEKIPFQASGDVKATNFDVQSRSLVVSIQNIAASSDVKEVRLQVWSEKDGQDDLKQYTANKSGNGNWETNISIDSNQESGNYIFQAYAVSTDDEIVLIGQATQQLQLEQPNSPGNASGKITIANQDTRFGTFDVIVSDIVAPKGLETVQVPVWSEKNNQDDLVWYVAERQPNGTYKVAVKASDHKYDTGLYQIHAYVRQKDGSVTGIGTTSTTVNITDKTVRATETIKNIDNTYGMFDVVISNIYAPAGVTSVKVAVWSDVNGRNDLRWYEAYKQTDGTYLATVWVLNHQYETGNYNAHAYVESSGNFQGVAAANASLTYTKKNGQSFIDVSSHNGSLSVSDYRSLITQGVSGVVVKLTEGTNYLNPYAAEQIRNAQSIGLKVSVYHYSHFTSAETAQAEARYFVEAAKRIGLSNSTLMVNDIEERKTRDNINANMKSWEAEMKRLGYHNLIHYTGASWIDVNNLGYSGPIQTGQFGISNFWVAQYPYVNGMSVEQARSMAYHSSAAAWQFTSKAQLLGGRSYFDMSIDYTGRFTH